MFRSESRDDILFVADDQTGFGYFRNFGKTRREGIELGLNAQLGPSAFDANGRFGVRPFAPVDGE